MANLISSPAEVRKISNLLEVLRSKGYNQKTIEIILEELLPQNDKYLINYQVTDSDNLYIEPAFFQPDDNVVKISLNGLRNSLLSQTQKLRFQKEYEEELREELFKRMVLFTILHEIEHIKQYFIAEGFSECPYKTVANLYKNILRFYLNVNNMDNDDLSDLRKDWNEIKKILIYMNPHRYSYKFFLERNANLVVYDVLVKVCEYEDDLTFLPFFQNQKMCEIANGYQGVWNGPAERSYRKFLLGNIFKSILENEEIPIEDRVCYGLPVDIKTRIKIVNRKFEI